MKSLHFAPNIRGGNQNNNNYYDHQRPDLGSEFLDAIEDALQRLIQQPPAHGFVPDTETEEGIRQVVVRRFPYRIVFREREEDLLVLVCMHARREPGYWRSWGES